MCKSTDFWDYVQDATADTLTFAIALCGCEQPVFDPLENQEDPAYTRADSLAADSTAASLGITIQSPEWGDPYYIGAF